MKYPSQGHSVRARRLQVLDFARLMPLALLLVLPAFRGFSDVLPGTAELTRSGDLAAEMVGGIDRYLDRVAADAPVERAKYWHRDFGTPADYAKSIETNRAHLATLLGVIDKRLPARLQTVPAAGLPGAATRVECGAGKGFKVYTVRWPVFRGVEAEGLLLEPDAKARAGVVAIPDCDWTPEQLVGLQPGIPAEQQFARKLASSHCRVLIPFLIDRGDQFSGLPGGRTVRQSQREVLWRAAYEMGRTIQGYEVQKVLAAVDCLSSLEVGLPIGIMGYGEGGMLAAYSGALDQRAQCTAVSGFSQAAALQDQPIYRNIWSFNREFGGAEIAGLIAPRGFVYEVGKFPETQYPAPGKPSDGAAPGKLVHPEPAYFEAERPHSEAWLQEVPGVDDWKILTGEPEDVGNDETMSGFLAGLGLEYRPDDSKVVAIGVLEENSSRLRRQYSQILEDTQWLMREAEYTRRDFWKQADTKNPTTFATSSKWYKDYLLQDIVGFLPPASLPASPRSRKVSETDRFIGYELTLDVHPDVFAYGILLVPKGIKPGERRPVVVCQHGLEGRPSDVADPARDNQYYHQFACRLAEQGFVTFAPQNCYIGENRFRQVLRKAQPLKLTLWSFILRQHEVILDWLSAQDFVDPARLAFYGLSYGGKTAVRIPPLLDRYCLSICSADYNEWIWKNVSIRDNHSYLFGGEYDMPEFNLGNTFNYAELSWLMVPRPFMVERGHDDGVAPDEWVAYEYAKTRRMYDKLGLGERTTIEFFNGPHTIHGEGTFAFLRQQLHWPPEGSSAK